MTIKIIEYNGSIELSQNTLPQRFHTFREIKQEFAFLFIRPGWILILIDQQVGRLGC